MYNLFKIDNVFFQVDDTILNFTEREGKAYLDYIYKNLDGDDVSKEILNVYVKPTGNNDEITLRILFKEPKFERIRRITGYLSSTIDTWNDSKKAEESERVKHL